MSHEVNIAVIGAGVVGLAIAAEISRRKEGVFVFEKYGTFGAETSSRNSEVIHAGIYYPKDSLKAKFCIEGRPLLYEFCERYDLPHKRLGKVIVAAEESEVPKLEAIREQAERNGVRDLVTLSKRELKELEPHVAGCAALLSPSSGIVDAYALMKALHTKAEEVTILIQ